MSAAAGCWAIICSLCFISFLAKTVTVFTHSGHLSWHFCASICSYFHLLKQQQQTTTELCVKVNQQRENVKGRRNQKANVHFRNRDFITSGKAWMWISLFEDIKQNYLKSFWKRNRLVSEAGSLWKAILYRIANCMIWFIVSWYLFSSYFGSFFTEFNSWFQNLSVPSGRNPSVLLLMFLQT